MSGPRFAFDFGMKQYIEESHVEFWKNSSDIGRKEKVSRTLQFFLFVNSDSVLVLWTYGLNYIWKQNKGFMDFVSITYELHRHTVIKKENQN